MVPGLLLPWRVWAAEPRRRAEQLTPFAGYSSAIDFRAMDEPGPTPHGSDIDTLQGERSGSWGYSSAGEVDDPGMVELLYSH